MQMGMYTKDNGCAIRRKVMEFIYMEVQEGQSMLDAGSQTNNMAKVERSGPMDLHLWAIMCKGLSKVKVILNGLTGVPLSACSRIIKFKERVLIDGMMDASTMATG